MCHKTKTRFVKSIPLTGFTLIELLVVIAITGVLIGLSLFGIQGARESARDANRKSDLEQIRSGLEIYKSDCGIYPEPKNDKVDSPLKGTQTTGSCLTANTYIPSVPSDPVTSNVYYYARPGEYSYILCAALEQVPSIPLPDNTCGGGNMKCGAKCNYYITNP